jgi:predicted nucleotidyltransferase
MFNFIDFRKLNENNNGNRNILESIPIPEIREAILDLIKDNFIDFVLIGGIALSYYVRPRSTMDIDILFLNNNLPDKIFNFKKNRKHAFQHNKTHVEVETLDGKFLKIPEYVINFIFKNSITDKDFDIKIADPSGLIVSKLFRYSRQDQADIESILLYTDSIDISTYNLEQKYLDRFNLIKNSI